MPDPRPRQNPGAARAAAARPLEQQRRQPADDVERLAHDLEELARCMRNVRSADHYHYHDLEGEAQRIGAAILAVFRKPTPSVAAPLHVSRDGRSAWF